MKGSPGIECIRKKVMVVIKKREMRRIIPFLRRNLRVIFYIGVLDVHISEPGDVDVFYIRFRNKASSVGVNGSNGHLGDEEFFGRS